MVSYLGFQAYCKSSAVVAALEKDEVLEQADCLYSCGDTEKLYHLLLQYKDSDDVEFLWRLARASRSYAVLPDMEASQKKQLIFDSLDFATKALENGEQCAAAHKWYAVCLNDVLEYHGTREKLAKSKVLKKHIETAIKLNPKDATSFYMLGVWCFSFAELTWIERRVATMIFSKPPDSNYEEALGFFLQAEEVDPGFYSKNLLMLGKTYLGLKDKEKALLWLNKAKDYPPRTAEDKQVHEEAVMILKKLG